YVAWQRITVFTLPRWMRCNWDSIPKSLNTGCGPLMRKVMRLSSRRFSRGAESWLANNIFANRLCGNMKGKSESRKDRIMREALLLFAEMGYADTSTKVIAHRAGVS